MHLYFFAGNCTEILSRKTGGAELLLPGLLSHSIPVLFTGSGLRIAAVFCIAIYFVFISVPGNEENMPAASDLHTFSEAMLISAIPHKKLSIKNL